MSEEKFVAPFQSPSASHDETPATPPRNWTLELSGWLLLFVLLALVAGLTDFSRFPDRIEWNKQTLAAVLLFTLGVIPLLTTMIPATLNRAAGGRLSWTRGFIIYGSTIAIVATFSVIIAAVIIVASIINFFNSCEFRINP